MVRLSRTAPAPHAGRYLSVRLLLFGDEDLLSCDPLERCGLVLLLESDVPLAPWPLMLEPDVPSAEERSTPK